LLTETKTKITFEIIKMLDQLALKEFNHYLLTLVTHPIRLKLFLFKAKVLCFRV